jgi:hypothetical protein
MPKYAKICQNVKMSNCQNNTKCDTKVRRYFAFCVGMMMTTFSLGGETFVLYDGSYAELHRALVDFERNVDYCLCQKISQKCVLAKPDGKMYVSVVQKYVLAESDTADTFLFINIHRWPLPPPFFATPTAPTPWLRFFSESIRGTAPKTQVVGKKPNVVFFHAFRGICGVLKLLCRAKMLRRR